MVVHQRRIMLVNLRRYLRINTLLVQSVVSNRLSNLFNIKKLKLKSKIKRLNLVVLHASNHSRNIMELNQSQLVAVIVL